MEVAKSSACVENALLRPLHGSGLKQWEKVLTIDTNAIMENHGTSLSDPLHRVTCEASRLRVPHVGFEHVRGVTLIFEI